VAIKVLLPEIAGSAEVIERFVREARSSSAIGSPHIPRYFDFGRMPDGRAYAVMELLNGETLAARLARMGPMSSRRRRPERAASTSDGAAISAVRTAEHPARVSSVTPHGAASTSRNRARRRTGRWS
jgi:serine/threonine protein kinase